MIDLKKEDALSPSDNASFRFLLVFGVYFYAIKLKRSQKSRGIVYFISPEGFAYVYLSCFAALANKEFKRSGANDKYLVIFAFKRIIRTVSVVQKFHFFKFECMHENCIALLVENDARAAADTSKQLAAIRLSVRGYGEVCSRDGEKIKL